MSQRNILEPSYHIDWLSKQIDGLRTTVVRELPSEVAEKHRYLSQTANKGPFRFSLTPYMIEPLDALAPDSGVSIVVVRKGVQLAYTTALLENYLLYQMVHVRTQPVLFVTADDNMVSRRMDWHIVPMLQDSNLTHLVQSSDTLSAKKQGKTRDKIEWVGGGFLLGIGANNPASMRSLPFPIIVMDEVNAWKRELSDGPPVQLILARTKTYEQDRKVLIGSTPGIVGECTITEQYELGDKRQYLVKCFSCGEPQDMRIRSVDESGVVYGLIWATRKGQVERNSVRWTCRHCAAEVTDERKPELVGLDNAYWQPTAEPTEEGRRSYQIPTAISLLQSWYSCAVDYQAANGDDPKAPVDPAKLHTFYNFTLGLPFEMQGQRVAVGDVYSHRRPEYALGVIPNTLCKLVTGHEVGFVCITVDVHGDRLFVGVWAWSRGQRVWLIDYVVIPGSTEYVDEGAWMGLIEIMEKGSWQDSHGREYRAAICLIDAQHKRDQVYMFCGMFAGKPVYPIHGRDEPVEGSKSSFSKFDRNGQIGFHIVVDHYKDRWNFSLRRFWDKTKIQPEWHFNAPVNISDDALKELTCERKVPKKLKPGMAHRKSFEWYRPSGSHNELWDLLVYATAALEITAWDVCVNASATKQLESIHWDTFWNVVDAGNRKR
jgi:phage terminase large subunit GpA-like protein